MRFYEVATAAAIILIAAVAMVDSSRKAGWTPAGPDTGFYPFWSAAAMAAAASVVFIRALRIRGAPGAIFESRAGARAFLALIAPMTLAIALIGPLGLYIVSGAYVAFFARVVGRYPWVLALILAIGVPLALYLGFERAFRFPLPKSAFYPLGILPI